jgi:hypothetical protein
MGWQDCLSIASNVAQTVTGIIALWVGVKISLGRRARLQKLERYLQNARREAEEGGEGMGARSIIHLMGNCALTEAQVLEAAFANSKIKSWVAANDEGTAGRLFFQFSDQAWRQDHGDSKISRRRAHARS